MLYELNPYEDANRLLTQAENTPESARVHDDDFTQQALDDRRRTYAPLVLVN